MSKNAAKSGRNSDDRQSWQKPLSETERFKKREAKLQKAGLKICPKCCGVLWPCGKCGDCGPFDGPECG